MKIGIFSDLHLGIKSDSHQWHGMAFQWLEWFKTALRRENVKDIIFLGDWFHNRNSISVITIDRTSFILNELKDFNLHMILGNHDLYYSNIYDISAVNLFEGYGNIFLYKTPSIVNFDGLNCLMCGWGHDPLKIEEKCDVLFSHMEINTFMPNGEVTANTFSASDITDKFKMSFSGHLHRRNSKKYKSGEIRYVGNTFPMDYGDENDVKGIEIFDTDDFSVKFIENDVSHKFVRIKLSELIKLSDRKRLKGIVENSFFKISIDKNISIQDKTDIFSILKLYNPIFIEDDWVGGASFKQFFFNKEIEMSRPEDNIREYVDMLDCKNRESVIELLLDLHGKALAQ